MTRTICLMALFFVFVSTGCKRLYEEKTTIYQYTPPPAKPISDAAPLSGSIKGTMLTGKVYTVSGDIFVNRGDTLIMQPGVIVNMTNKAGIIVQGVFASLGTRLQPNFITVQGLAKTDAPGLDPSTDPAYSAHWKGIIGDTSCKMMVLKWTHLEFGGSSYGTAVVSKVTGVSATTSFVVLFQNSKGSFVMEDSWIYGATDDAVRLSNGKVAVFRNTFEKAGLNGGDCVNMKGGTVGDAAYNMFIGTATNGLKVSNKGQPIGAPQTNVIMYNNTFVNGGYRQIQTGRGADIDFEEGARGMYFNNITINCKFGPRVVSTPAADTAHMKYGNNFQYADSLAVANQFYPVGYITRPQSTDLPLAASFLPVPYKLGSVYNGSAAVREVSPFFLNYPLPVPAGIKLRDISAQGNFNFRLQSSSTLLGKGNTGFSPQMAVVQSTTFGVTEYTQPGKDLGAFQYSGSGNQH